MNVRINLPSIKDQEFVSATRAKIDPFLQEGETLQTKIYSYVQHNLGGS